MRNNLETDRQTEKGGLVIGSHSFFGHGTLKTIINSSIRLIVICYLKFASIKIYDVSGLRIMHVYTYYLSVIKT